MSVRDYVREINAGLFDTSQSRISGGRAGFFGAQVWLRDYAKYKRFDIELSNIEPLKQDAGRAQVAVSYRLIPSNGSASVAHKEVLDLQRGSFEVFNPRTKVKSHIWQIVLPAIRPAEPQKEALEGVDWLAYFSWKLAQKPLEFADYAPQQSLENLRFLSLAAAQFSQDYNSLAVAPEYLEEAISPYLKDESVFFVPNSYERYAFNANLSGRYIDMMNGVAFPPPTPTSFVAQPEKVILFYEGRDEKLNFRYDGRAAVSFTDGHVALISPDEAKNLRWLP